MWNADACYQPNRRTDSFSKPYPKKKHTDWVKKGEEVCSVAHKDKKNAQAAFRLINFSYHICLIL